MWCRTPNTCTASAAAQDGDCLLTGASKPGSNGYSNGVTFPMLTARSAS